MCKRSDYENSTDSIKKMSYNVEQDRDSILEAQMLLHERRILSKSESQRICKVSRRIIRKKSTQRQLQATVWLMNTT